MTGMSHCITVCDCNLFLTGHTGHFDDWNVSLYYSMCLQSLFDCHENKFCNGKGFNFLMINFDTPTCSGWSFGCGKFDC